MSIWLASRWAARCLAGRREEALAAGGHGRSRGRTVLPTLTVVILHSSRRKWKIHHVAVWTINANMSGAVLGQGIINKQTCT